MTAFSPAATKVDRAITVTIMPWGIRPSKIQLPTGAVALVIENRSLVQNLSLAITQEGQTATAMTSQHGPTTSDAWHFVAMQPGTYHLSVSGRPSWQCTFTVSGK